MNSTLIITTSSSLTINFPAPMFRVSSCSKSWPSLPKHHSMQMEHAKRRTSWVTALPSTGHHPQEIMVQEDNNMEEMIVAISEELASHQARIEDGGDVDEALQIIDLSERLGIQRYFKKGIESIIQCTYREWKDEYGMRDQKTTVLAFRLLRLHGYHVSAGVLEKLKDENGEFSSLCMSSMLNLYRCTEVGFQSELNIMSEIKDYASGKLFEADTMKDKIKYAIEFPRPCRMPRVESRNVVRHLWPGNQTTRKYLELAKMDLNILQNLHQKELAQLERWWIARGFNNFHFSRKKIENCFFGVAPLVFEPEFSRHRRAFVKAACLVIIVDDLFDSKTFNIQDLRDFTNAVKRWDASLIEHLPQCKLVLEIVIDTIVDLARESSKDQGYDLLSFFQNIWANYAQAFLTEAEWFHHRHVPTLEEYLKVARYSSGGAVITWTSIFLLGKPITIDVMRHIGIESRFMYLVDFIFRLVNDLTGIEREAIEGKIGTAVNCYLRDNPQCTMPDAITAIQGMVESACLELELELFKSRAVVPDCCGRAAIIYAKMGCFFYRKIDGFSEHCEETINIIKDYLFEPL